MTSALSNAKKLVDPTVDDAMARAALAVQNSAVGAGRKARAITSFLNNKQMPTIEKMSANKVRAVVMQEIGEDIALDDPFLVALLATQDAHLDELMSSVKAFKSKYESSMTGFYLAVGGFAFGVLAGGFFIFNLMQK